MFSAVCFNSSKDMVYHRVSTLFDGESKEETSSFCIGKYIFPAMTCDTLGNVCLTLFHLPQIICIGLTFNIEFKLDLQSKKKLNETYIGENNLWLYIIQA